MQLQLDSPFSIKDLSFWTPTKILYDSHALSKLSRLEQILSSFLELADKFCYLGSASTEFQPYSALNFTGQKWIYHPRTTVHFASSLIEKIVKIFALIILLPITVLSFGAKCIYKGVYLPPIIKESIIISPHSTFSIIEKMTDKELRIALKELPEWIKEHFPKDQGPPLKDIFPNAFNSTELDTLDSKTLKKNLTAAVADFCREFGSPVSKAALMLRGLNLPKNGITRAVCMEIIITSWEKALSNQQSYAHCTNPITLDSFECLKNAIARCPKDRRSNLEALLSKFEYKDLHIFNTIKMCMLGPAFTIGLTGQGNEISMEKVIPSL